MKEKAVSLMDKRAQRAMVGISTRLSCAIEMVQQAKALTVNAEMLLVQAHLELESLYMEWEDQGDGVNGG